MSLKEFNTLEEMMLIQVTGTLTCDSPNEYLDKWDGNVVFYKPNEKQKTTLNIG